MPPEALQAACVNADPSIDIWAMGVILYLLIYGALPFQASSEKELIKKITTKEPDYTKSKKRISKNCIKLIQAMLNKNPKLRIKMNDIYSDPWFSMPYFYNLHRS